MKYRYVLRNIHTNKTHFKIYSLESIEKAGLKDLFDVENYEIISRDVAGIDGKIKKYIDVLEERKDIVDRLEPSSDCDQKRIIAKRNIYLNEIRELKQLIQ